MGEKARKQGRKKLMERIFSLFRKNKPVPDIPISEPCEFAHSSHVERSDTPTELKQIFAQLFPRNSMTQNKTRTGNKHDTPQTPTTEINNAKPRPALTPPQQTKSAHRSASPFVYCDVRQSTLWKSAF
mmetsp:Transcript_4028/g.5000  ORF Transcript_4028/g.5000 Transcript_4028/m.5000 type:complete len:128 (+) Transcript_4028:1055-1438(+)